MVRRNTTKVLMVIMAFMLVVGCSLKREIVLTPEQEADRTYYAAKLVHADYLEKFANAERKYNVHYAVADTATQNWLTENVDQLWVDASDMLDAWKDVIEARQDPTDEMEAFKLLKTQILLKVSGLVWED